VFSLPWATTRPHHTGRTILLGTRTLALHTRPLPPDLHYLPPLPAGYILLLLPSPFLLPSLFFPPPPPRHHHDRLSLCNLSSSRYVSRPERCLNKHPFCVLCVLVAFCPPYSPLAQNSHRVIIHFFCPDFVTLCDRLLPAVVIYLPCLNPSITGPIQVEQTIATGTETLTNLTCAVSRRYDLHLCAPIPSFDPTTSRNIRLAHSIARTTFATTLGAPLGLRSPSACDTRPRAAISRKRVST
jgi:hypothetical protein